MRKILSDEKTVDSFYGTEIHLIISAGVIILATLILLVGFYEHYVLKKRISKRGTLINKENKQMNCNSSAKEDIAAQDEEQNADLVLNIVKPPD